MLPRTATPTDIPAIQLLIARSARELSAGFYTPEQIEAAITHIFGVDTQLITDGSYFVIDAPDGLAAAGGWSARRTLFGGDQMKNMEDSQLDPAIDAARIRAFFVDPRWARRGLARALYNACEKAAADAGFQRFELMATAPGEPVYERLGFSVIERVEIAPTPGVVIPFARMTRTIASTGSSQDEPTHRWYTRPVLFVADVNRAIRFYVDTLGFAKNWHEGDGAGTVCQVSRGECEIILCEDTSRLGNGRLFISLTAEAHAALLNELRASAVATKEMWWGYDTVQVDDPDGNELLFPRPNR